MFSTPRKFRLAFAAATAFTAGSLFTVPAIATENSDYPNQDITLVVPFGPGGGSDVLSRTIVNVIKELDLLPVELLIENRPGGSGAIGYKQIADQAGDPYTLGTVSVSFFTTPLLGASPVSYEDFTPVAAIAMSPYILAVRADSKFESMEDLADKEKLSTSTVGIVSDAALLSQMLQEEMDTKIDAVPFDGEGEAIAALLGNHINFMFGNPGEVLPQIRAGELRPIAVSTEERLQSLPDIPTLKELGYDVTHTQLRGLVMPDDVPQEAVAYWEEVLKKVTESQQWKEQYLDRFMDEPYYLPSEEFGVAMEKTNTLYNNMMSQLDIIEK